MTSRLLPLGGLTAMAFIGYRVVTDDADPLPGFTAAYRQLVDAMETDPPDRTRIAFAALALVRETTLTPWWQRLDERAETETRSRS